MTRFRLSSAILAISLTTSALHIHAEPQRPNIIFVYADDAGYADYQPYNEMFDIPDDVRIRTPNVARLAEEGMVFTNAHATGSVCQPSRYSLMSGELSFRKLVTGTLAINGEPFIEPGAETWASFLRDNGYQTALIGKWHLDYAYRHRNDPDRLTTFTRQLDHHAELPITPLDYGFDHAFWLDKGVAAAEWFIKNRRVVRLEGEIPYSELHPDKPEWPGHKRWQYRKYDPSEDLYLLPGPDREYIGDILTDMTLEYMEEAVTRDDPFFIFLSCIAPHTPHLPTDHINGEPLSLGTRHFDGTIADRPRQKMVYENDIILGQIMEQLERLGIEDNTMVIFTSDNGAGRPGTRRDGAAGNLHGWKGTLWEGGTRMPFIVKWPGVVEPGTVSDQLISQVDMWATVADVLDASIAEGSAPDSRSFLPALLGKDQKIRSWSISNRHAEEPYDTYEGGHQNIGATSNDGRKIIAWYNHENSRYAIVELYDLNKDPSETNNLVDDPQHADTLRKIRGELMLHYGVQWDSNPTPPRFR